MVRKMSLKEYLKKSEVFVPETRLHNTNVYNLLHINSFLNRNEQMILNMSLEKDKLKIITEEDLLNDKPKANAVKAEEFKGFAEGRSR